ncbi:hypothetical protein M3936_19705 [Sutcliffiella horikoshii]|uniref:hypothetical protein n=1 Tax=Sutcliffiella horikoshii TaxID=79883 RepID=UPI00203DB30F|nr:hypothetical protein [Sutcliffiella horikoshii]MCM3619801.1 hypothetical protein [Sutcliffiella horikoshii]
MFLQVNSIIDYIDNLKEESLAVEVIELKYNEREKQVTIESYGSPDIVPTEDYYENVLDYLEYTYLSWLSPFIQKVRKGVTVTIQVKQDGTFKDNDIQVKLNLEFGERVHDVLAAVYRSYQSLSQFQKYIEFVEFKGSRNKLRNIIFGININAKEFGITLQKGKPNAKVAENWSAITDIADEKSMKQHSLYAKVPVVNGKMVWEVRKEKVKNVYKAAAK